MQIHTLKGIKRTKAGAIRTKRMPSAQNTNLCTQNNTASAQKPPHPKKQKMPAMSIHQPVYFISIVNF